MEHKGLRRHILAFAAISMAATAAVGVAEASPGTPVVTISLPAPTGANAVGMTEWHLVDDARADPWDGTRRRELMVQIWYPAGDAGSAPVAAWMPPGGVQEQQFGLGQFGVAADSWKLGPSHSRDSASARVGGRFPILLNSPGMGDTTGFSTAQAEDLASHGYIVVAINHTHESFAVQFPDGRTERGVVPMDSPPNVLPDLLLPVRVADARFVLDQLAAAAAHPGDAALPQHLAEDLDLTKVGMFGHSLGGSTTAQTMHDDPRIAAGVNLDGPILGSVAAEGLDRPMLMLASDTSPWFGNAGWEPYWATNSGVKLPLRIAGTRHMSLCDEQVIAAQLATAGLISPELKDTAIGTIDATRSVDLQRAYLLAYFDAAFGRGVANPAETITRLAQPEMLPHP
ncbi:alpha/beta hydrolase family protein [Nocardia sp. NPDC056100]|uniref:alpha/beta hydrolase family protein n=1 Tax=Nocardia sp. NPDC056100 TaxID=3345712 RepID=UPI0035DAAAEF